MTAFCAIITALHVHIDEIEYLLTQMRRAALNQLFDSILNGIDFSFYYSLALHCFTNEYIFFETDEEIQNVTKLENKINYQVNNNLPIPPIWIVLLAAYRPLHNYLWAEQLQKTALPVNSHKILTRQLFDIKKEQHLKTKIHQLNLHFLFLFSVVASANYSLFWRRPHIFLHNIILNLDLVGC